MLRPWLCALSLSVVASACTPSGHSSGPLRPTPAPAPSPDGAAPPVGCSADAQHCCQPDGTIVAATCAPVIRQESDSRARAVDGACAPCMLRCLPSSARIRALTGEVAIDQLEVSDQVWTVDAAGAPRLARIVQINANPVLRPHQIIVIVLADGRTLRVSSGHPAVDGTPLGALGPGRLLDGAAIVSVTSEPYVGAATWDVLVAGETGAYWADGILIGSTLLPPAR